MNVMRKPRRTNWFLRNLVVGLALVVIAVPVAQARVDGSSGWSGPRGAEKVTGVLDAPRPAAPDALRSNQLGMTQPKVVPQSSRAPTRVVSRSDGFDWGDAGIGAGTVVAVMLLAAGGMLGNRHKRGSATA